MKRKLPISVNCKATIGLNLCKGNKGMFNKLVLLLYYGIILFLRRFVLFVGIFCSLSLTHSPLCIGGSKEQNLSDKNLQID